MGKNIFERVIDDVKRTAENNLTNYGPGTGSATGRPKSKSTAPASVTDPTTGQQVDPITGQPVATTGQVTNLATVADLAQWWDSTHLVNGQSVNLSQKLGPASEQIFTKWMRSVPDAQGHNYDPSKPADVQRFVKTMMNAPLANSLGYFAVLGELQNTRSASYDVRGPGTTLLSNVGRPTQEMGTDSTRVLKYDNRARQAIASIDPKAGQQFEPMLIAADKAGVPWQVLYAAMHTDGAFKGNNADFQKYALQLGQDIHRYQSVTLALVAHKFGTGVAEYVRQWGQLPLNLRAQGLSYLQSVLSTTGLDLSGSVSQTPQNTPTQFQDLGYSDAKTASEFQFLASANPIQVPDKTAVSTQMDNFVRSTFLRDPVPGEGDSLANAIIDHYTTDQQAAAFNPFAGKGTATTQPFLKQQPTVSDEIAAQQAALQSSPEYQSLYGQKPAGTTEAQYQQQFAGAAQSQLGQNTVVPNDVIRGGLGAGDPTVAGDTVANNTNLAFGNAGPGGFRERLFSLAALINNEL